MKHITRTLVVLVALGTCVSASCAQSNNVTQFDHLRQPRISMKRNTSWVPHNAEERVILKNI